MVSGDLTPDFEDFDSALEAMRDRADLEMAYGESCRESAREYNQNFSRAFDDIHARAERLGIDEQAVAEQLRPFIPYAKELGAEPFSDAILDIAPLHPYVDTTPEDERAAEKLKGAFVLLDKYGEEASLPIRQLLDDIAPYEPTAVSMTQADLDQTPAGSLYRTEATYDRASSVMAVHSVRVSFELAATLGERDDSTMLTLTLGNIALNRLVGDVYAQTEPTLVAKLLQKYPGKEKELGAMVDNISEIIATLVPEYPIDRQKWAPIVFQAE